MQAHSIHKPGKIIGPGYRHRDIPYSIFNDEVPAYDPCEKLAKAGIGISVSASAQGDHRGEFGIT